MEFSRDRFAVLACQAGVEALELACGEKLNDQPGWRCCRGCVGIEIVGECIRVVKAVRLLATS